DKLTIEPKQEILTNRKSKYIIESGNAYAIIDDIDLAYNIFVDQVLTGKEGLCISRIIPKKIRDKYGLKKTPIMWLNDLVNGEYKTINSLSDCSILISDYLKKAKNPIILLDGLEYLVSVNEFNPVLRFLQSRRSLIESTDSILLIPYNSQAIEKKEHQLIIRELSTFKKNVLNK
ncbi:DUF835 domain-containing protein, partial [Thermoproteota archaeon]